jgi:Icc-related predicted phosphoesterase
MTRIVAISDTHGKHLGLQVPDGDVLIHCGDFCNHGTYKDAVKFIGWFQTIPHKHKIFIAGNHDLVFEQGSYNDITTLTEVMLSANTHYLNDSGVNLHGINFWGSPVQPRFFNWAFNRDRGPDIKKHWDKIPSNTDVLITHGPPYGILDEAPRVTGFDHVGCKDLLQSTLDIAPKLHLFGHIHFSGGKSFIAPKTTYINASLADENYAITQKPFVIDIENGQASIVNVL